MGLWNSGVTLLSFESILDLDFQQLVASMICLKARPPPRSMSNEPVPGRLGMSFSVFSLDNLF